MTTNPAEMNFEVEAKRGYFINKITFCKPHSAVFLTIFDLRKRFKTASLTAKEVGNELKPSYHNNLSVQHISHILDDWAMKGIIHQYVEARKKYFNIPKMGDFSDLFTNEENAKLARERCKKP